MPAVSPNRWQVGSHHIQESGMAELAYGAEETPTGFGNNRIARWGEGSILQVLQCTVLAASPTHHHCLVTHSNSEWQGPLTWDIEALLTNLPPLAMLLIGNFPEFLGWCSCLLPFQTIYISTIALHHSHNIWTMPSLSIFHLPSFLAFPSHIGSILPNVLSLACKWFFIEIFNGLVL